MCGEAEQDSCEAAPAQAPATGSHPTLPSERWSTERVAIVTAIIAGAASVASAGIAAINAYAAMQVQRAAAQSQLELQRATADEAVTQHYLDKATDPSASLDSRHAVLRFLVIALAGRPLERWATQELAIVEERVSQLQALQNGLADISTRLTDATTRVATTEAHIIALQESGGADHALISEVRLQLATALADKAIAKNQRDAVQSQILQQESEPATRVLEGSHAVQHLEPDSWQAALADVDAGFSTFAGLQRGDHIDDACLLLGESRSIGQSTYTFFHDRITVRCSGSSNIINYLSISASPDTVVDEWGDAYSYLRSRGVADCRLDLLNVEIEAIAERMPETVRESVPLDWDFSRIFSVSTANTTVVVDDWYGVSRSVCLWWL